MQRGCVLLHLTLCPPCGPQNCTWKGLGSPGSVGSFWVSSPEGGGSILLLAPRGFLLFNPTDLPSHTSLLNQGTLPSEAPFQAHLLPPCQTHISLTPAWRRILMVLSHQRPLCPDPTAPPPPHGLTCHPTTLLPPRGAAFRPKLQHGVAFLILHRPEPR